MRLRLSTLPLVAGCSTGAGATMALLLGTYVPGWGLVGGVALALVTLTVGLFVVPGHRELVLVTLALACLVLGFLAGTVAATLVGLEDFVADKLPELRALARASVTELHTRLVIRWAIAGLAALVAGGAAWGKRS
jgi:hypothetical protein